GAHGHHASAEVPHVADGAEVHDSAHAPAHGDAHGAPSHPAHLHDAPWPMATALIVLALGSILAGYIGIPHALGGHNALGAWLQPAFTASNCGAPVTTGALAGLAIENCEPGEGGGEAGEHAGLEI